MFPLRMGGDRSYGQTHSPGKKTTIRIGSPFKAGHILVDAAEKFKELIEKGSGGRIAVQFEIGTKSEEEIVNLNSAGAIEMQSNGTQFLQTQGAPVLLLHQSLRHEGLRTLHASLGWQARPAGVCRVGEERQREVPGNGLPRACGRRRPRNRSTRRPTSTD